MRFWQWFQVVKTPERHWNLIFLEILKACSSPNKNGFTHLKSIWAKINFRKRLNQKDIIVQGLKNSRKDKSSRNSIIFRWYCLPKRLVKIPIQVIALFIQYKLTFCSFMAEKRHCSDSSACTVIRIYFLEPFSSSLPPGKQYLAKTKWCVFICFYRKSCWKLYSDPLYKRDVTDIKIKNSHSVPILLSTDIVFFSVKCILKPLLHKQNTRVTRRIKHTESLARILKRKNSFIH